jgi:hypothetical protein
MQTMPEHDAMGTTPHPDSEEGEAPSTSPMHNASSCPAPPAETCNVHLVKDPSKTLRVSLGCPSALSSIWLWSTRPGGPPLLQAEEAQLAHFSVSVGLGDTETGCAVADFSGPGPETPPYHRMALVCGARTADRVTIKMPRVAAAAPQPVALAVKVCSVRGEAAAGMADPVLYLQAPAGYM